MIVQRTPLEERVEKIESLVAELEHVGDPKAQAAAQEMVRAILDLHAAGLAKVLDFLAWAGDCGRSVLEDCSRDDLVSHLLLLHGLHPDGIEARVRHALEGVRPYLQSHGGNVELLGVLGGTVRLRMEGSCHGCPSSRLTLKGRIERAIYDAAPDVMAIEVDGAEDHPAGPIVQLQVPVTA